MLLKNSSFEYTYFFYGNDLSEISKVVVVLVILLMHLNLPLRLDELICKSIPSPFEPPDPVLLRLVPCEEAEGEDNCHKDAQGRSTASHLWAYLKA